MILDNYNPLKKHILIDSKNRTVYYDYRTKTSYYLTEEDMGKYKLYSNRWMFAIAFAILAGGWFFKPPLTPIAIAIGFIIDIVLLVAFKTKFLPSLTRKENVNVEELVDESLKKDSNQSTTRMIFRILLYIAFGVLLVLNAYDRKMNEDSLMTFYLSWGLAIASVGIALSDAYKLITKK